MYTTVHGIGFWSVWLNTNPLVSAYIFQVDVKANSDLKHVKDSLAAEKKKKKTLLKSMDDVSNNNCKLLTFSLLNWLQGSGE